MSARWFGEPWPEPARRAAACADDRLRVPTPAGQPCLWCAEDVVDGDRGQLLPVAELDDHGRPVALVRPIHAECLLRSVLGGPGHLLGTCGCHGDGFTTDDPDLGYTPREAARWVWDWVREHGAGTPPGR